jgi:general secretion pathway protein N
MKLLRNLIVVLIVVVLGAAVLLWTCPADVAYRELAGRLGPVRLDGLSGSLRQGHAASIEVFGQNLGALDWRLQAAPLLHGELVVQVNMAGTSLAADGLIARGRDGQISCRDTHVHLPAETIAPAIGIPALNLIGTIDIELNRALVHGVWLDEANGVAHWRNASVSGAAQAALGDLEASFASTANGTIAGVVRDLGGPLQADGTFEVGAGRYAAQVRLAPRDGNAQVIDALRFVGQPQTDGSSLLEIRGQLLKFL